MVLATVCGCAGPRPEPVRVFAAASTGDVMTHLAHEFQAETGVVVELNLGPSSALARQIEQGAAADLFLAADEEWADHAAKHQAVARRRTLLTNRLVVVTPADSRLSVTALADLAGPGVKRLSLAAAPVPAGRYAREALTRAGVWERVQGRVIDGGDVRAALRYVETQEAEAGIVYATDAREDARVRVALTIDPALHGPIRYPWLWLRREPEREAARRFYDYVSEAGEAFRRAGFGVADE